MTHSLVFCQNEMQAIADILITAVMLTGIVVMLQAFMKFLIVWQYILKIVFPAAFMIAVGLSYFGVLKWISCIMMRGYNG